MLVQLSFWFTGDNQTSDVKNTDYTIYNSKVSK